MKFKTNKQYKRELTQAAVGGAVLAGIGLLAFQGLKKLFTKSSAPANESEEIPETEFSVRLSEEGGETVEPETTSRSEPVNPDPSLLERGGELIERVEETIRKTFEEDLLVPRNSHKRRKAA